MPSYESTTRRITPEQPGLCALIQDLLPFYLEDEVSPESHAFIDAHMQSCERCASFLAGARSVRGHLRRETLFRRAVGVNDRRARELITRGQRQILHRVLAFVGAVALLILLAAVLPRALRGLAPPPSASMATTEPVAPAPLAPTYPPAATAAAVQLAPTPTAWPTPTPGPPASPAPPNFR